MSKKSKPSKTTANKLETRRVATRRTRMIALEPRMLFDGALGLDLGTKATAVVLGDASQASSAPPDNLAPASPESTRDANPAAPAAPKDTSTAVVAAAQTAQSASATPAEKDALQKPGAEALDAATNAAAPKEVVFVDSRVTNYQGQLAGVDPNATIVFLDASKDGVTQIADAMANTSGITAVHIIAEGSADQLLLGSGTLDASSMTGLGAQRLSSISDHITADAKILVHEADFGQGTAGSAVADRLALLTSADVADVASDGTIERVGTPARQEIVFVDPNVADFQTLVNGIDNPNARVVLLDDSRDGVQQILDVVQQYTRVDAIHIISHGSEGQIDLAAGALNSTTIAGEYAAQLAEIGKHLGPDADVMIYGCNFGKGDDGALAAQQLAQVTGAEVAASVDDTGDAALGGNWNLERQTGKIDTGIVIDASARDAYHDVLALHTLDFDTVGNWTAGSNTMTYTVDGYPVTVTVSPAVSGTPALSNSYTGGQAPAQNALQFTLGATGSNTITIDFSGQPGGVVSNVGFALWDVDNTEQAVFSATKADGSTISPTQVADSAFNTITAGTPGTGTSVTVKGTGTDSTAAQANGNVYVYFNTTDLKSVSFTYTGTANTTLVVLNDITFMGNQQNPPIVDLDASTGVIGTAADGFPAAAYTGTTGTIPWNGAWTETDSTGAGATAGQVQVVDTPAAGVNYALRVNNSSASAFTGAQRAIDLSSYSSLTLSYNYMTSAGLSAADQYVLEISTNGGSNWTMLKSYGGSSAGAATNTYTADSVSLAGYESANTVIRFRASGTGAFTGAAEYFYIDDVQITASDTSSSNAYTEGDNTGVRIAATANALITDPDSTNMSSVKVQINNVAAGDVLTWTNTGSITGAYNSATGILQLSGVDSKANYQTVIDSILYKNTGDDPTLGGARPTVTVGVTATDSGFDEGNTALSTITITGVNDAPTLAATPSNPTFQEAAGLGTQAAAVGVFSGAAISTIESGQTVTELDFTVSGLVDGANEKITVDGKAITLGANSSGTTTTNAMGYTVTISGGVATVVLTKAAGISTANAQTLVNGITYQDTITDDPTPGSRVFTLTQIKDNGGTANGGVDSSALAIASTVNVVSVNDAPAGTNKTISLPNNATYTFTLADFGFSDVDGNALQSVIITSLPGGTAAVKDAGVTLGAGAVVTAADIVAGKLQYVADTNNRTFTFQVQDDGGTASGGQNTDQSANTFTMNTPANNTAPVWNVAASNFTGITEAQTANAGQLVSSFMGTVTDPDAGAVNGIAITATAQTNGTWQYSVDGGTTWTNVNAVTNTSALLLRSTDMVRFAPNGFGSTSSITYRAWDETSGMTGTKVDTSTNGTTTAFSTTTHTSSIAVSDVAPTITSSTTATVVEGTSIATTVYTASATDWETVTFSLSGADAGAFNINSSTGVVTFKAIPDYETKTTYNFNIVASDATLTSNQAVTVNVTDVAPTISSSTTATVAEGTSTATVVYTAAATDVAGGTVTYALTGTDAASFSINSATGAVTFVSSPDFETKSSYSINIKASDPSGAFNTQAVTVNVTDVAPTISSSTTATVAEGTSTATVVYTAAATDVNGGTVTYALTGTDAASFSINSATGAVTFVSSPDFETKSSYSINVKASDPSGAFNTQAVTVNVTDVAPTISSSTTATVAEGTSTATVVYTAAATDVNGGTVTYALTGADAASFNINSATGAVTFVSSPDFETKSSYSINVKASDPSGANNVQAVTINVTDVAPTITSATTATVAEGTSTATTVYTASATDPAGGTVTYALTGTDAASFTINAATGAVKFVASPDFETKSSYSINVKASDPSGAFNTQAVTVNVTDVAPTITSSTTATVAEGTSTATVVYTAAATDVNGGTVTYALTGTDAASFSINSATGAVTFVSSPDFETKSSYSINVKASDPSGANNVQAVTINVTDVAPTISSSTTATVAEGTSTATVVYTAAATDVNGGTVTYALTGTDAASFSVNSATGAVTFVSSPDFETKSSYSINVKASDASGAFNTQAVTVNVTDVAPTISSSTTATVVEGTSTATVVYTAAATDVNGGTVTYALTGTDAASFSINSATGAVTFVSSPDFETKTSYSINVKASDPSGANNVQAVTINVTDVAPTITSATTATVAEGTSTATVVYTAAATDVNGGAVTYSLTGADAASFSVNSATGAVTFVSSPDFETKSSYSINVKASDASGAFNTQAVTVNVTDVAPTISSSTTATVAEGTSTATVVYTAAATDVNGGTVTYALTGADAASFNINSATGAVTFVSSPDFETKSSYSINVKASDPSGANNVQAVTINVTDVAPTITSATTATVAEGTSTATTVYTASATDPAGGTVTYALTGTDAASFTINAATGAVKFVASPDFETKSSYSFNVKASDPSGANNVQAVTINVTDVAPTITSATTATVAEGTSTATVVYTAAATDVNGGTVTYSLTGADAASFSVNSATGAVTFVSSPDFETKSSYSFNVKASDPSGAFNTQAVTVNVTDVAPTITSSTTATVAEGTSTATVVYTAVATDVAGGTVTYALTGADAASFNINSSTGAVTFVSSPDFETKSSYSINVKASDPSGANNVQAVTINVTDVAPTITSATTATVVEGTSTATVVYTAAATDVNGGTVTYSLTGADAASFSVNSATGAVTFVSSPDFETKSSYSFNVKASDPSGAFNTQAVTVNVTDVAPTISSGAAGSVTEGAAAGTTVYNAAASDVAGGTVTYALTGVDAGSFTINSSTGVVTINAIPDFETKSSYSFNVKASDPSGAFNTQAVTVNVTDVAPTITSSTTATVAEGTSTATVVYTAAATDVAGGTVTYALTGADAASFNINSSTGAVTFISSPDFETKSSYAFNVKASDPSGAFNTQAVTVNVTDVAPTISSSTTTTVAEGTSTATVVYTAAATDVNGGAVTYALTGADAASFSINSATGAVTFVSSPDFETKSSYSINVKASDPSGAFNTQAVTVNVTDVAPTISSSTTATVAEGTSTATVVYTAAATDVNGGTVTYALTGADAASFNINSSTGAVTFVSSPDFETKSSYSINVKASDPSGANNVQAVTINVTDVAPTITSATTATVAEGTSTATTVYTASATDPAGGTVTYALTGTDAASFSINSATGAVTFVSSPDFETKSSYSINVKASDPSGANNVQAVTINVTDVAPTISSSTTATVAEGTSTATVVYTAAATDVNGGTVTYALTGTDAASFSINSATGAVTFVSSPDFETKSSYSINVKASDPSGANNVQAVTINVTDVAPTITSSTTATVVEGTSTATVVYTAAATDVNGGTVTYALTGTDAASFSINSATGAVTFVSSPDFETKTSYSINVKASDPSGANNVQAVTINVTDVAPTITSATTATVAEGTSTATVVYTAAATDVNGGAVTYSLTGADAASFSINSATGAVTFVSSPDFETKSSYSINVKASDPSGAFNTQAVTVNVTDVAPTISSSTTATVAEGTSTATVVYTAAATDVNGGTVTYALTGADAASFNINSSTGAVTFVSSPDFETKSSYSINVKASDPSGANNVQAVTINVTDVAPTITSATTATVVEGTSTATVVYTAAATDVNGGTVTYSLTGADAASFSVNSATGAVTFVSSPDFETKSSYSFNVKASDPSGAFNTQAVTVNVTDVAPTITSSTTATVAEGTSTATVVYTAVATDVAGGTVTYALTGADAASFNINSSTGAVTFVSSPDFETKSSYSINVKASDPSGANNVQAVTINVTDVAPTITSATTATVVEGTSTATVVYTASATDPVGGAVTYALTGADAASFSINSSTGAVTFVSSPDFETKSSYSINVKASDPSGANNVQAVTVNVTDVAPAITSSTTATVAEGTSTATVVYTAAATDVNGGTVTYALTGTDAASFSINSSTGAVTFVSSPDFETKSSYSINVKASDPSGANNVQAVTINVTDVAPTISSSTTATVAEGTSTATVVYTAAATDVNGGTVTYALTGADAASFNINSSTGAVTFVSSPDFETKSSYSINIKASDPSGANNVQAVTINVTDVAPTITSSTTATVAENTSTATVVYTAAATDVSGGTVTYSLTGTDAASFNINSATGAVTFVSSPDFETKSSYSINIKASDPSGANNVQAVTINITNVNEAPSGANATVAILENTTYTFASTDFGFSDPDAGDTLTTVRIDSIPGAGTLTLAGSGAVVAGQVVTRADIDAGKLQFTPVLNGSGAGYASVGFSVSDGTLFEAAPNTVTIDVGWINHAPTITSGTAVAVPEGIATSTVVYAGTATDLDGDTITWSLSGADAAAFTVNAATGAVKFNASPDFETKSAYSFNVVASDGTITSSQAVTVSVSDVAPTITSATSVSVPEGTSAATVVYTAAATDVQGGAVSFSLGGADAAAFTINAATGAVSFNASPDFETKSAYSFNVVASDGTLTSSQAVTVSVTDVAPTITSATSVSVPEGTSAATVVYTAAATDVQGGAVSFSLGGADAAAFTINAATGAVTFNASPDFETKSAYSFNVVASDGTISSSQAVTVSVTDVAPSITSATTVSVPEGTSAATVVYTAAATDVQGGAVSFSLSGADAAAFTINAATGAVTFNASPDFETKSAYSFNVVASDGTISSSQAVTVSVTDVAPTITSTTSVSVPEGTSTATVVYTAAANDVQGGAVSFSLGGADAAAFTINAATGAVTFNASPDYETKSAYSFNVVASDGTLTSSQAVTVSVTDVAPTITSATSVSVPEGTSTATVVYTAAANDVQGGAVSFSLTGADAAAFSINAATGAVSFNASPDFETKSAYTFNVVASDGTITSSQAVTVAITDVAPTITSTTSVSVPEGTSTATVVYSAAATDVQGGAVTFSLGGADAAAFSIDATTGAITFNASPDFETKSAYTINVMASDGTLTSSQVVTVSVTDVAPTITSATTVSVPEGTSTAAVVYTASATDVQGGAVSFSLTGADAGAFSINAATGQVTFNTSPDFETKSAYSFNVVASDGTMTNSQAVTVSVTDVAPTITSATTVSVPEGTNTATVVYTAAATDVQGGAVSFSLSGADAAAFTINAATGAVTFNASPDFETKSGYSFNVVANDGTISSSQAVTLSVTDVAPTITSASSVTVPEGTSTATVVYTAAATDVQGGAVSFSLSGADAGAFTINAATGAVTFNASPDFETKSAYSFNVVASDGTISSSQAVTVSVSDVAPAITSTTSVSVPEGTSAATVVYTAAATDVQGGAVSFSLSGADAAAFTVNAATGAVTFNASPDFETKSAYTFNVVASDGTLTSSQAVTVSVSDVAPTITSATTVSVPENTSTATVVYTAAATDVQGGAVSFSLTGADAGAFTIDATTGAVTFNASPDFETKSAYTFNVVANDGTISSSQAVTVSITDINEAPTGGNGTVATLENTAYVFSAVDFGFADPDAGNTMTAVRIDSLPAAGTLTLSGSGAVAAGQLITRADIDAGKLQFVPALNGSGAAYASLDFSVRDAVLFDASPNTLTIDVGWVNHAPSITSSTSVAVAEGIATTTVVYTASATDIDAGDTITWNLAGADAGAFTIDSVTGAVTFNSSPDFETKSSYTFSVVASDGTTSTSQAVTVSVTDIAPTITSATSLSVPEGTSTGTVVYTAAATDPAGGTVSFSLTGADASAFSINAATGAVTFNSSPDYETKSAYTFNVVASDGTASNAQAVTVSVTDVAPTITSATSVSVPEGTSAATVVYTASATDVQGGAVSFSLTGADAAAFTVNAATGAVKFNASPDFETKSAYSFNVVASDGTITSSQAVTVSVSDVAPTITSATSVSVPEGTSAATVVYTAAATDVQGGAVSFSLGGADAAAFTINAATGAVSFNASPDFETKSAYSFNVVASDGTLTSSQAVTVSVTDVAPTITSATSVSVPEGTSAATVVYTAAATDVQGGAVSFSLGGADAAAFTINAATGAVTFNASPDFETKSAYSFNVVASDGTISSSQAVTVSVTDVAPSITSATTVSVPEGTSAATVVYTAAATDVQGGAVSFSLSGADAAAFTINAATGAVTFNASPDFETKSAYSFNVVASDGTISSSQAVTVSVTDVAPTITSTTSVSVPEGTSTATVVYTAAANDVQGGAVSFSLGGADAAAFTINAATGAVTFNASPDYETKSAYSFNVVASDGTLTSSQAVTVSVTDVAPTITSATSVSVPEGTSTATVVYTAAANDVQGGAVSFSLTGADAAAFSINAATGAVSFNASPDFETKSAYTFNVVASDGTITSSQAVTVAITDVNEAPVVTSAASASFVENTTGAVYAAASADPDAGDTIVWTISGPDAGLFTINPATGAVSVLAPHTVSAPGDANADGVYDITLTATDSGGLAATKAVQLTLAPSGTPAASTVQPTTPQQPDVIVNAAPPSDAAAPIVGSSPTPGQPAGTPAADPGLGLLALGQPVDATVDRSSLGSGAGAGSSIADRAMSMPDLNALPATAAGPDDLSGFPVQRVSLAEAIRVSDTDSSFMLGGQRLFVYHGIPDMQLLSDGSGTVRIPQDAFAHTDPSAIVRLEARYANGLPLPSWLKFEGTGGTFHGIPPEGLRGSLDIEVIARDGDGREAHTLFSLEIADLQTAAGRPADLPDLPLGLDVDAKEKEKARIEAARQAAQRGDAVKGKAGADAKGGKQPSASFTDQLKIARAPRDPLLDRITGQGSNTPRDRR